MKKINKMLFIIMLLLCFHNITLFSCKTKTSNSIKYLSKNSFISSMAPAAVEDMKKTGVYASVTLGQAAVESGWGKDSIAQKYNNYFGMKAGSKIYVNGVQTKCSKSNTGTIGYSQNTNEYWSGMAVCLSASEGGGSWFRVYDSAANSIGDHSRNLWCASGGRYINNGVFASGITPQSQLYAIAKSGYAVDKNGNITVISGLRYDQYIYNKVITPNGLNGYDTGYKTVKPDYANSCTTAEYKGDTPVVPDGTGSSYNLVTDFSTTYTGDIKQGYIYTTQKNNALLPYIKLADNKIDARIKKIINEIFGNASSYSITPGGSGSVEIVGGSEDALTWKQYDPVWGSVKLGSEGETIKSVGCLATSVAIQIKLSGTKVNTDNFNPGTWVNYLNSHNGFKGSSFVWSSSVWSGIAPNWQIDNSKLNLPSQKAEKIAKVKELLNQGYYPVMCVKANCGHWVAVTGVTDSDIQMADPGSKSTSVFTTYKEKNVTRVAIFKKTD